MRIVPIIVPSIGWEQYLQSVNSIVGRSPTRMLDQSGMKVGDLPSFVASLGDFYAKRKPHESLQHSKHLLQHLSFSFLISFDSENSYLEVLRMNYFYCLDNTDVDRNEAIVISGTLFQFYKFITENCNESTPFEIRLLANSLYLFFQSIGFGSIFYGYKKEPLPNSTFMLRE